jgi:hypothetical protein
MIKPTLWIDLKAGISCDRFAAALIGLGAPERGMLQAIRSAGEEADMLDVHRHFEFLPDETLACQLHILPLQKQEPLPMEEAPAALELNTQSILERHKIPSQFGKISIELVSPRGQPSWLRCPPNLSRARMPRKPAYAPDWGWEPRRWILFQILARCDCLHRYRRKNDLNIHPL